MAMIFVNKDISIPEGELEFSFVKASGSGGQKVNKTNSQVQLRWNLLQSSCLDDKIKSLLINKLTAKLTNTGDLIISSEQARSQHMNKQNCIDKFIKCLQEAAHVPKARKKTKPTKGSKERRLKNKKMKSETKKLRQKKPDY